MLSLVTDDLRWIIPQLPEFSPLAGERTKEQWEGIYRGFLSRMPNGARYTVLGMIAEGDRVAVGL